MLLLSVLAGVIYLTWRSLFTWSGTNPVLFSLVLAIEATVFLRYSIRALAVALGSRRGAQPSWSATESAMAGIVVTDEAISQVRLSIHSAQQVRQMSAVVVINAHGRLDVREQCARMGVLELAGAGPRDVGNVLWQLVREARDELLCFVPAYAALHPESVRAAAGHFREVGVAAVTFPVQLDGATGVAGGAGYRLTSDADPAFAVALDAFDAAAPFAGPLLCRRDALAALPDVPVGSGSVELLVGMGLQRNGWTVRVGPLGMARRRAPWSEDRALRDRARLVASRFHLRNGETSDSNLSTKGFPGGIQRVPYLLARLDIASAVTRLVTLALPPVVAISGQIPFSVSLLDALVFGVPWFVAAAVGRRVMAATGEPIGSELRRGIRTLPVDLHVLRSKGRSLPGEREAVRWQFRLAVVLVVAALISAGVPFTSIGSDLPTGVKFVVVGSALVMLTLVRDLMWASSDRERRILARAPLGAVASAGTAARELSPLGVDIIDTRPFEAGEQVQITLNFPLPGRREWQRDVAAVVKRSVEVDGTFVAYAEFRLDPASFDELQYFCSITANAAAELEVPMHPVRAVDRVDTAGRRPATTDAVVQPLQLR